MDLSIIWEQIREKHYVSHHLGVDMHDTDIFWIILGYRRNG